MSVQEAKAEIMLRVESKISREIAQFIKNKEEEAEEKAEEKANELLALTMTRYAQDATIERTVSTVS